MGDSPPAVFAALDRRLMAGIPTGCCVRGWMDVMTPGSGPPGDRGAGCAQGSRGHGVSPNGGIPERYVPESGLSPNGLFLMPKAFRPLAPGRDRSCRAR